MCSYMLFWYKWNKWNIKYDFIELTTCILILSILHIICFPIKYASNEMIYMILISMFYTLIFKSYDQMSLNMSGTCWVLYITLLLSKIFNLLTLILGLGWSNGMLKDLGKFLMGWHDVIIKVYFTYNIILKKWIDVSCKD